MENFIFCAVLFTLHANIPCHKLKSVMTELVNFCFNGGNKEFIGITRYGAIWTKSREKQKLPFNKTPLQLAINYLLGNSHLTHYSSVLLIYTP